MTGDREAGKPDAEPDALPSNQVPSIPGRLGHPKGPILASLAERWTEGAVA